MCVFQWGSLASFLLNPLPTGDHHYRGLHMRTERSTKSVPRERADYQVFTKYVRSIDPGRLRLLNAFYLVTHPLTREEVADADAEFEPFARAAF